MGQDPDPATASMNAMLVAYADGEVETFNSELAKYQKFLRTEAPANVNLSKANFETFFNHFEPFYHQTFLDFMQEFFAVSCSPAYRRLALS